MEKLKERLDSCQRALSTLDEALNMPFSIIVRDGAIQRFEFSFEVLWKVSSQFVGALPSRAWHFRKVPGTFAPDY